MANLSRLRRERMFDFLNNLKVENRHDEKILQSIAEIENELNEKKYGLVWEEHSEQVDEMMVDNIIDCLKDTELTEEQKASLKEVLLPLFTRPSDLKEQMKLSDGSKEDKSSISTKK